MPSNDNTISPLSPRDIDTFIALNVHYDRGAIKTHSLYTLPAISLPKDLSLLDVNKTLSSLRLALTIIFTSVSNGEKLLFVRSRKMNCEVIDKFISKVNQVFLSKPVGGILSNWSTFSNVFHRIGELTIRIERLKNRKLKRTLVRQLSKWTKRFIGFNQSEVLPKVVIVSCDEQVNLVIKEANKLKIPVIGFVDASFPSVGVDFVVPVRLASRVASLFIYRLVFVACSIASMTFGGERTRLLTYGGLNSSINNLHFNLFISCLHFKRTIVDQYTSRSMRNCKTDLVTLGIIRKLELKPILHWLLSNNLASSTLLKTIVRYVTISQLRMTGNAINLSCFTRKLIVNFRRIR
ncbi:MAG: 30S ribosomal protein S2, partial [Candidatus Hodgkinia cicadicola]